MVLTDANAQHDPHCPWFLTGVTAPFSLQSTYSGSSPVKAGSMNKVVVKLSTFLASADFCILAAMS